MDTSPVQKKRKRGFPNKDQRSFRKNFKREGSSTARVKSCLADLEKIRKGCLPRKLRPAVQKFRKKPAALSFLPCAQWTTKRSLEQGRDLKRA
jgi:hypothetical protein